MSIEYKLIACRNNYKILPLGESYQIDDGFQESTLKSLSSDLPEQRHEPRQKTGPAIHHLAPQLQRYQTHVSAQIISNQSKNATSNHTQANQITCFRISGNWEIDT